MTDVRFEHSPGRGHPGFTADYTAFNVLIRCTTPQGRDAFVAIELKYSEAPAGIASPGRPRYDTLSRSAGVFRNPDAPALRHAPIEQFWREQLLVTTMLERGHYHDGRLIMIAPALNAECQAAIARYRADAAVGIDRFPIGKGRIAVLHIVVLMVLLGIDVGISETLVDQDTVSSSDPRDGTVEDTAVTLVLVEAEIDEVTQKPASLRTASCVARARLQEWGTA